ncbi:T-complex-associated testis-expressed protein 1 [Anoplophora glabripennis]|uniref:T-complex-associated testis-expressed protein 1 n=1 Tax=Anoplophora glabripennis TaxID=217634 RepID=UPI0008750017|nr:T-complex-associated testis-expressed protein 1 [Anoplophora glabripennis]
MRIPHIINKNTFNEYKPSPESLELIGEGDRTLVSENFDWNKDHCPSLVDLCVQTISKYFHRNPILHKLPCVEHDHLLEIVSCDLPLIIAVTYIQDEYYWQRRYTTQFGLIHNRKPLDWTWKSLYLERSVQEILEQAQPQYNDEETFEEILSISAPYVQRLIITQLQSWKPPLTMEKEDIPEEYPTDHINFIFILRKLPLIREFDIVYGVNSAGEEFNLNMFKVSVADCQRLGRALLDLNYLTILRIHRSKIEYLHCQALMQNLIKNHTIVELDLSHCEIGDQGALCVANVLQCHPSLKILNLTDNNIREIGAEGLGFAMVQPGCADLEYLSLRLNPLGSEGVMCILRALVRCTIPTALSMSGSLFEGDTAENIALMLKMNDTLKRLELSSNWIGEEGGEALLQGLEVNTTLEYLDIRDTDVTSEQMKQIEKILMKNRCELHQPGEEIEEGIGEEEVEEKVVNYNTNESPEQALE